MFGKTGLAASLGDIGVEDLEEIEDIQTKAEKQKESASKSKEEPKEEEPKEEEPKKVEKKESKAAEEKGSATSKQKPKETTTLLDTKNIVPWTHDDRQPDELESDVQEMIRSIQATKQTTPILVRPLKNKKDQYEEIFGRVRLEACRALGIKVEAQIKNLTDQEAFALQAVENSDRSDISAWSKAVSYKKAMDSNLYDNLSSMAARINKKREYVTKLFNLAKNMPESVSTQFAMTKIGQNTLEVISASVRETPDFIKVLLENKDRIHEGKVTSKEIKRLYERHVNSKGIVDNKKESTKTISGNKGDYFTVSKNNNGAMLINVLKKGKEILTEEEIIKALKSAMDSKK